jgi:hypothetical protein
VALEEHVFGPAETDAHGAKSDRVPRCSGVSALVRTDIRAAASHHFISCWKLLNFSVCLAAALPSMRPATISDGAVFTRPAKTFPAVPSIDSHSPSL